MTLLNRILSGRFKETIEADTIEENAVVENEIAETLTSDEDSGQNSDVDAASDDPDTSGDAVEASETTQPEQVSAANPADVAEFCAANGCAGMAAGLIREGVSMDVVRERVGAADTIRQMVADAGRVSEAIMAAFADEMISAGLSVDQARAKVFDRMVARQSGEIRSSISSDTAISTAESVWSKAVAKQNANVARKRAG